MKVAKDLVVSLAYQVRTEDGVLVDESPVSAPLDYLHGHGSLISGLETALEGHEVGDKFDVAVGANDAYGQYDENLVQRVPKDVFMGVDELQVGMRFLAETDQGPVPVEITAVEDDHVVVDGNHMLAGQNLKFNVEVVAIREATEEELAHGHVHGAHDHHHDHDHDGCCGGHGHDHGHEHGGEGCCGGKGKSGESPLFLRLNNVAVAFLQPATRCSTAGWLLTSRSADADDRAVSPSPFHERSP